MWFGHCELVLLRCSMNHSCEPNCYTRVVTVAGKKHILIFAKHEIAAATELFFDYKMKAEKGAA